MLTKELKVLTSFRDVPLSPGKPPPRSNKLKSYPKVLAYLKSVLAAHIARSYTGKSSHPDPTWKLTPIT